jgi:transcription antitermination factor NusG
MERTEVRFQTMASESDRGVAVNPAEGVPAFDRNWYAVFTVPQHEKSVVKHLDIRKIESFLPTYEVERVWKNRQRMRIVLPLFPTYLFVHINSKERVKVLESPGVLQIVGSRREPATLSDSEIEFLRSGCRKGCIEAFSDLVIGKKVRIKSGPMEGIEGTLVRKDGNSKFVLTLALINQHAAIQVDASDLEPVEA